MKQKLSRLVIRTKWHARRAGGLFIGLRLHFPVTVLFDDIMDTRRLWLLCIGLLVVTIELEYRSKG
jgi:hypothetical protein